MRVLAALVLLLLIPSAAAEQRVDGAHRTFFPDVVLAGEWETVRWTWPENETHGVVSEASGEEWCAPARGGCFTFFERGGEYRYHCPIHPDMRGTVVVGGPREGARSLRASFVPSIDGLTASFDARALAERVRTFEWDFGDGSFGTGPLVTHDYARAGLYIVRLSVVDEMGNGDSGARRINVTLDGDDEAAFRTRIGGGAVAFDASPLAGAHAWDFGDGSVLRCDAEGACEDRVDTVVTTPGSVLHVYRRGGEYVVNHSVGDLWSRARVQVPGIETFSVEPDGLRLIADARALRHYGNATYTWRFGDLSEATGARVAHEFPQPGRWSVDLTLVDDAGSLRLSREVPLTHAAPTVAEVALAPAAVVGEPARATPLPVLTLVAALAIAALHRSESYK